MHEALHEKDRVLVNNAYYDTLGDQWWTDDANPIALLRAESQIKIEWVLQTLRSQGVEKAKILDVGCGAGFVSLSLARHQHEVWGVDLSESSLEAARSADQDRLCHFERGDAYNLSYHNNSFDVVVCFDFLEHVSQPQKVVTEAARVLKPGGLFFYHTFSRNLWAELIVIKGLEWFVRGTPEKLHVKELFLNPEEVREFCERSGLCVREEKGIRPVLNRSFFRMLLTGRVDPGFAFCWTSSKLISYAAWAEKLTPS